MTGRRPDKRWIAAFVVLAVALVGLSIALALDDDTVDVSGGGTTTTTAPSTTSSSSTTTSVPNVPPEAIWPPPSIAAVGDPEETARRFATTYLGFASPVIDAAAIDGRTGDVSIRPRADGPVTRLHLARTTSDDGWSVLGATTDDVVLTSPQAGTSVSSPVVLEGTALAFEGNVQVEVRADGAAVPLSSGAVTGGGDVPRPFRGTFELRPPTAAAGAIVLTVRSAEDGQVWQAVAVRIRFTSTPAADCVVPDPSAPGEDEMVVRLAFSCDVADDEQLVLVDRVVPRAAAVLRATLDALLAGPTAAERANGVGSWFSEETAASLRSVDLDGGRATVDFDGLDRLIPNASASAGSQRLLAELDGTVLAVPGVTSVEYRLDGDCTRFAEWLQLADCVVRP